MKIGILSDTHGYMDERIVHHLSSCDEIWHAGDVGPASVLDTLEKIAPTRCVFGNIDGQDVRKRAAENLFFECSGLKVMMRHIAGYPGRYNAYTQPLLLSHKPDIVVAGHSHILKVVRDQKYRHLHINPGAAGIHGFHKVRTLITMEVEQSTPKDLKVIELGPRGTLAESVG